MYRYLDVLQMEDGKEGKRETANEIAVSVHETTAQLEAHTQHELHVTPADVDIADDVGAGVGLAA